VHKANKLTKIGLPARNLKRQGSKQTSSFAHISILGVWLLISVEPANPRAIEASSHNSSRKRAVFTETVMFANIRTIKIGLPVVIAAIVASGEPLPSLHGPR
jgi:hypothetical protein